METQRDIYPEPNLVLTDHISTIIIITIITAIVPIVKIITMIISKISRHLLLLRTPNLPRVPRRELNSISLLVHDHALIILMITP